MSSAKIHAIVVLSIIKAVKYAVSFCLLFKLCFNVVIHLVAGWFGSWLKTLKKSLWKKWMCKLLKESRELKKLVGTVAIYRKNNCFLNTPHLPMVRQKGSQNGIVSTHLQLARGCELVMESGMTVACCTEVCVSCCHAGGRRICWVPDGQACCKVRIEVKQRVSTKEVRYISSRRSEIYK